MRAFVAGGRPQNSENSVMSFGTTFHNNTNITPIITSTIIAGYMSAPMSFREREESFSICVASWRRAVLSFPVFSPDSTMAISESEKLFGKSLRAFDRLCHDCI